MSENVLNVELGHGGLPFIEELRPDLIGDKPFLYIDKRHPRSRDLVYSYPDGAVVTADANNIPLPENSVHAFFAKDLFGAHKQSYPEGLRGPVEDIGENIPKELTRVCEQGGKLIILETATPPNKEKLIKELEGEGFSLIEDNSGNDILKIFGDYDATEIPKNLFSRYSYALIFQKIKK